MKNTLYKISLLFLILFLVFACKNRELTGNINDEANITGELEKIKVPTEITDLSKDIEAFEFIQLESNSNCIIGEISKLLMHDEKYFIFDKITKSVFCFNNEGKFLYKVSKQGKGPGEYYMLKDININREEQCIELYDRGKKEILSFSFQGNFKSKRNIDMYFDSFINFENSTYVFQKASDNPEHFNYYLVDDGKIKEKYVQCKSFDNTNIKNQISKNMNRIFMAHGCSNVIYTLIGKDIKPKYFIDFGEENLPSEILYKQKIGVEEFLKLLLKNYSMIIMNFYEDNNFLTFSYTKKKKLFWVIKDFTKNTIKNGNILFFGTTIMPPLYKYEDTFYSIIDLNYVDLDEIGENSSKIEKDFLQRNMKYVSTNMNPVIFKFSLKK